MIEMRRYWPAEMVAKVFGCSTALVYMETRKGYPTELDHDLAAMMARDIGGVVDETFRVYGTQNLRVVDASILPMQLSAHPSLTLFGIAEKAAAMVRNMAFI